MISVGMSGALNASFEFSRLLVQRGHTVVFVSSKAIGDQVRAQGFEFLQLTRDLELDELVMRHPRPPMVKVGPVLKWFRRRVAMRRQSIEDPELEEIVKRFQPDLLLIDIEMHAAVIVTARFCIPTLLLSSWFSIFRSSDLPPLHTHLGHGVGRFVVQWAWAWHRITSAAIRFRKKLWIPRLWRPIPWTSVNIADLSTLAKSRGYDLRRSIDSSQWLRPYLYRHISVLCFNALEMELPHEPHPNLRYVGPMVNQQRKETRTDPTSYLAWQRFREQHEAGPEECRLVYCSLGSHWSADRAFLGRVLEVFRRRTDWNLVLGLGDRLKVEDLGPISSNILLLRWAPQLEVLSMADCAITHGGIGTINECITFAVPMVVYSTKHGDQNGCAVRVVHHLVGVSGDKDREGPDEIEAKIQLVLSDPKIRSNVEKMRQKFSDYEKRGDAVRVVEDALKADRGRREGGLIT